ncbi:MAG: sigma-70 family RNA polymerase sigma factor [Pirellulales bacterium]
MNDVEPLTDGQLLERYIAGRDEAAFAELLRRHGPMVLAVCRRALGDSHDADDAFQATFLVLVRKAPSIVPRDMVGNWLYGVAHRTALKAQTMNANRKTRESRPIEREIPGQPPSPDLLELKSILDNELSRLPDKYRAAIVLADLEGRSRQEAARQLGVPEGTLSSRLARGRELLRRRLSKRGLALGPAAVVSALAEQAAAGVSAQLEAATLQAASAFAGNTVTAGAVSANVALLTQGVIQTMAVSKMKMALVASLATGVVAASAAVIGYRALAAEPGPADAAQAVAEPAAAQATGPPPAEAAQPSKPDAKIAMIERAWQARQAKNQAFSVAWEQTEFVAKNSHVGNLRSSPVRFGPPEDLTITKSRELVYDGRRLRHSFHGPHWITERVEFLPRRYVDIFDGVESCSFFGADEAEERRFHAIGFINRRERSDELKSLLHLPIILPLRPFDMVVFQGRPIRLAEFELVNEAVDVGGRECWRLDQRMAGRGLRFSLVVDPERGFLPVQVMTRHAADADPSTQTEIEYSKDEEQDAWHPSRWQFTHFGRMADGSAPATVQSRRSAKVSRFELNPRINDEAFAFDFPPGTRVNDRRDADRKGWVTYLVRLDGSRRVITQDEMNSRATHEQLMATETGEAVPEGYLALVARIEAAGKANAEEQARLLEDLKKYIANRNPNAGDNDLAGMAVWRIHGSGRKELAIKGGRQLTPLLGEHAGSLIELVNRLEGADRQAALPGHKIEVTGKTVDGKVFDWAAYRGKVVLVEFWFMGCEPCIAELPYLKHCFERYHERGFEIVGITIDQNGDVLKRFLDKHEITWPVLAADADGIQPTAQRYGISSYPTHILVGRDGKVLSMKAVGTELNRLLVEIIGLPWEAEPDPPAPKGLGER